MSHHHAPETIASLFSATDTYAVPPYQRAYSWEEKQVDQFLDDLQEHPAAKPYYLGHFLFERHSDAELFVIDGQQRLSSLVLLIGVICQELVKRGQEAEAGPLREQYLKRQGRSRFRTVREDADLFADLTLTGSSTLPAATRSQERISKAHQRFQRHVRSAGTDKLLHCAELLSNAQITRMVVVDKVQATQIFTLQNSRGKELTEMEKLKAFLMYQVYLHSPEGEENAFIKSIERQFENIYTTAERLRYSNEDQILRCHDRAYSLHSESPMENLKRDIGFAGRSNRIAEYVTQYCKALAATFSHVEKLEKLLSHHEVVGDLVILGGADAWPLLIKLYALHGEQLVHDPELVQLLKNAEVTLMKFDFVHKRSLNDLPDYAKRFGTEGHDLEWLSNQLKWTARNGFRTGPGFNMPFLNYLQGDYHYHRISRYILWKYENRQRHSKDEQVSPGDYLREVHDRRMETTIEHLASQSPREGNYSVEFTQKCLQNLGNLLFMPKGLNSALSNLPPEEKAPILAGMSYASHREAAAQILKPCEAGCDSSWCHHKVESRKQDIINFAVQRWEAN